MNAGLVLIPVPLKLGMLFAVAIGTVPLAAHNNCRDAYSQVSACTTDRYLHYSLWENQHGDKIILSTVNDRSFLVLVLFVRLFPMTPFISLQIVSGGRRKGGRRFVVDGVGGVANKQTNKLLVGILIGLRDRQLSTLWIRFLLF